MLERGGKGKSEIKDEKIYKIEEEADAVYGMRETVLEAPQTLEMAIQMDFAMTLFCYLHIRSLLSK